MQLHRQPAIIYLRITLLSKRASPAYQVEVVLPNLQMMPVGLRFQ
jgi:hypothetical protein